MRAGDFGAAERAARTCIRLQPGNAAAYALLGEILACQTRLPEAEREFHNALRFAPQLPQAVSGLIRVLQSLGRHLEALRYLSGMADSQGSVELHAVRAHSLLALHRLPEAIAELRAAVALDPANIAVTSALASALLDSGEAGESTALLREAIVRHPHDPGLTYALARIRVAQRDFEGAEAALRGVLKLQPGNDAARITLAEMVWMRSGDCVAAAAILDEWLRLHPDQGSLRVFKARLLESAGRPVEALHTLEAGLRGDPPNHQILLALAQAALRTDPDRALACARQVAAAAPRDGAALLAYGNALLATGHAAEAGRMAATMRSMDASDGHAIALQVGAWRALGDARYRAWCDYASVVRPGLIDVPDGWSTLADYLADLTRSLLRLHTLHAHPIGQSLRGGTQVDLSTDSGGDAALLAFGQAIRGPVERYIQAIGHGDDPLRSRTSEHWKLSGIWSVKLGPHGSHVNHYHPEGWLSSACYIHLPQSMQGAGHEGSLQFGEPGFPTVPSMPPELIIKPEPGMLVLFPAWMWHGTLPFTGGPGDYRLTVAFDVVPEP